MVYAVAMKTIAQLRARARAARALGAPRQDAKGQRLRISSSTRLRIYPHALPRARTRTTARDKKALLFGYFPAVGVGDRCAAAGRRSSSPASRTTSSRTRRRTRCSTAMHRRFMRADAIRDVLAFHEAFADIVALFQHFTLPRGAARPDRDRRAATSRARACSASSRSSSARRRDATARCASAIGRDRRDGEVGAAHAGSAERTTRSTSRTSAARCSSRRCSTRSSRSTARASRT